MSLGSQAWRRVGTWPQSTLSRAAHCARAHTQRASSQRDHNAPSGLPSVEHLLAQGRRQVGAWAMRRVGSGFFPEGQAAARRPVAPHLPKAGLFASNSG